MSVKKSSQERHRIILDKLLKENENKYCADCLVKAPRWASWNLGIFICIRCAGIHRNLGVHISRVKSVNLDVWNEQQIAMMEVMGNGRARAVYEAQLPSSFIRPETDSSIEMFIRSKYERQQYIDKSWVPPQLKQTVDSSESTCRKKTKKATKLKAKKGKSATKDSEKSAVRTTSTQNKSGSSSSDNDDRRPASDVQGLSSAQVIEGDLLGDLTNVQSNIEHSASILPRESSQLQYLDGLEMSALKVSDAANLQSSTVSSANSRRHTGWSVDEEQLAKTGSNYTPSKLGSHHINQTYASSKPVNLRDQVKVVAMTTTLPVDRSAINSTMSKPGTGQTLSTELWQ